MYIDKSSRTFQTIYTLNSLFILLASVVIFCCAPNAGAAILHVGADWEGSPYGTIQAAVDAASDGDELWVEQGTYTLTATIDIGKAISLYGGFIGSETSRYQRNWAAHPTVIDGNNSVRCFLVYSTIIIDGFTITKGSTTSPVSNGAGIWNGKSTENYPSEAPGYLTLTNCSIFNNSAGKHAALFNDWGTLTVDNCTFSGNSAVNKGAAITNYADNMTITNCIFAGNSANNGGAITLPNTFGTPSATAKNMITDCIFTNNRGAQDGGAIIGDGNLSVTRCSFDNNTAGRYGTIAMRGDTGFSAVFTNCLFAGNSAKYGAAICINGSSGPLGVVTAMNCTFAGNILVSGGKGGVIYTMKPNSDNNTAFTITNSILWGNGGNAIDRSGTTQPLPTVTYTDIDQDGYAGSNGNIKSDPLFAGSGDYHLQAGSLCIDNATASGAPATDRDGVARPQGSGYDMGAYEYTSVLLFQFVQLSDTHIGKYNTTQALVNLKNAVTQINGINPAFVLITGDLTDAGKLGQYEDFKNAVDNLTMPYHCVPGDNDVTEDGEGTVARYRQVLGDDYSAFDYGGFKFIGLNLYNTDNFTLDATQLQWLEDELKKGKRAIIFAHEPLLDYYDNSTIGGAEQLLDLLQTYQAPLYMNGHTHKIKQCIKNGTGFVWCKNLFAAQYGDPYNLYKVYTDRILLYHVDLCDGSQTLAWTLCLTGTCADDTTTTTTTTTSIETTTTTVLVSTTTVASTIPSTTSTMPATTTTTSTNSKLCPAEVVFGNEPATLDLLRRFRDRVLSRTPEGRRWTALYSRHADVIADLLEKSPELRLQTRAAVERLLPYINRLADDKAVNLRRVQRDARALINLF